jgi:hypothetical protein
MKTEHGANRAMRIGDFKYAILDHLAELDSFRNYFACGRLGFFDRIDEVIMFLAFGVGEITVIGANIKKVSRHDLSPESADNWLEAGLVAFRSNPKMRRYSASATP